MMEDRTDYVRVTNGNRETVLGRFNGQDFAFKSGEPVDIPIVVARHVFAFGLKDKTAALNRIGWAKTSEEVPYGLQKLEKVTFDDPPEMIEAPRKPKRKAVAASARTGSAGPPVAAGGTEGGSSEPPEGPVDDEGDEKPQEF
jgi:hypothetical protein